MKKVIILLFVVMHIAICNAQLNTRDSIKQILQNDKEDTNRVQHLADLSFEYFESKPDTTMVLALEALALANRIHFEKGKAISLNRIGNAYEIWGNYPKAMEAYLQALKINESINNVTGIQRNYNNIGVLYSDQEDYRQALDYFFDAKTLGEQINNKFLLSSTYVNIADAYLHLKTLDSARFYANQSYEAAHKINYTRMMGSSLHQLGNIYFETEQNTLSLEYYRLSISYSKEAKNDVKLSDAFLDMAKVFEKMRQIDSVILYAKRSLLLAREKGFTRAILDAARFLSFYYRKLNSDSAFFYQDVSRAANDSLFSQQKTKQLQSLSFDEKLRQQEIVTANLIVKEERQRNLQYAAVALGLISFLIFFLLISHSIVANQKLIKFLGIVALLMVFEFINLYIHPYLSHITNDSPFLMFLVMVFIASILVPAHHWLDKWVTHQLVEKNKKIRLAAAKKTIQQLEGKTDNS